MDQAIEFAAMAHKRQTRKGTEIPYISHPFGVAMLLQQAKRSEDVVIAGILHDTLEDTDTTEDDIRIRFGEKILRLVVSASEPDKSDSWEARKLHTLEFLKTADLDVRHLTCADKLHNLRSIRREVELIGQDVWNKFNRGYDKQHWYYTSLVESLGYRSRFPMLDAFQNEVEALFLNIEPTVEIMKCRGNKNFYDVVFELLFCESDRANQLQEQLSEMNAVTVAGMITERTEAYRLGDREQSERKQEMYAYLTSRGIEFEMNSEGTDIIISACAALKEQLHLFPHEVYHHFYRNLKRGLL
jgi:hypothetical protein